MVAACKDMIHICSKAAGSEISTCMVPVKVADDCPELTALVDALMASEETLHEMTNQESPKGTIISEAYEQFYSENNSNKRQRCNNHGTSGSMWALLDTALSQADQFHSSDMVGVPICIKRMFIMDYQ